MRKTLVASILAASLAVPALASSTTTMPFDMNTVLGTTMEEVRSTLAEMGFEIRKSEMEDGHIEVYIVRNGQLAEVYVSPQTGKPVKISMK